MMSIRINELFMNADKKRALREERKAKEVRENFYRNEEIKKMNLAGRKKNFKKACEIYDECLA